MKLPEVVTGNGAEHMVLDMPVHPPIYEMADGIKGDGSDTEPVVVER